jgi:peptidoglycan/LPS O-acetylase OafA/YrhL
MHPGTSPLPSCAEPPRIAVLDGIRGLAILMVLLCHFSLYGGMEPGNLADLIWLKLTLPLGCGVELFFVLSGFLITGILLETKDRPGYFRNFYMRRVLRIFPLYYGTLAFFYVLLPSVMPPGEAFRSVLQDQAWDWAYVSNIRVALEGWPRVQYLGHFWSLAIEEQFYMVWPALVLLCSRRWFLGVCGLLVGLSLAVRWGLWLDSAPLVSGYITHARLDALVMGAVLAAVGRGPRGLAPLRPWAWGVGGVSLLWLVHLVTSEYDREADHLEARLFVQSLYAVVFGSLLVLTVTARKGDLLERIFAHRALVFLGIYSYGLYVFHHPIVVYPGLHGFGANLLPEIFGSHLPALLAVTLIGGAVCVGVAVLSYHLYEQRFLKLKRFFTPSRRPVEPPSAERCKEP